MIFFSGLEPFLVHNQSHTNFNNYVRSFEIYARAAKIQSQQDLKDNFLAKGGQQLRDVYFLLPGSVVEPDKKGKPYDDCIKVLKKYFKSQTSSIYEKYMLRQIVQGADEDFQTFLMRIREQASRCEFRSQRRIDEEILDQIVFGTNSEGLRADLLKSDISLKDAIDKARRMEGVTSQMRVFSSNRTDLSNNGNVYRLGQDRNVPNKRLVSS